MHVHCRWVDSEGNHKFETFIPEVERPACSNDDTAADPLPGEPKRKPQPRRPTDKGAMYHEFSREVWEWLTHIRRVHWNNAPVQINGKTVKACNPLAPSGEQQYYVHSKIAYYYSFFFEFWDNCFAKTFSLVCPFYDYTSVEDFIKLFDATFEL